MKITRALISVSDKKGIASFGRELERQGVDIISTGGTAELLRKNKISPEEALYAGLAEGGDWLDWLADRPRIAERGYVDAAAWRSALAQARLANTAGVRYFQAAASLEAWLRFRT